MRLGRGDDVVAVELRMQLHDDGAGSRGILNGIFVAREQSERELSQDVGLAASILVPAIVITLYFSMCLL